MSIASVLTDIANALRVKKQTSGSIVASTFPTAVSNIRYSIDGYVSASYGTRDAVAVLTGDTVSNFSTNYLYDSSWEGEGTARAYSPVKAVVITAATSIDLSGNFPYPKSGSSSVSVDTRGQYIDVYITTSAVPTISTETVYSSHAPDVVAFHVPKNLYSAYLADEKWSVLSSRIVSF